MLSSENSSNNLELIQVENETNTAILQIPEKLTFRTIVSIKVPAEDPYKEWDLTKLLAHVEENIVEEIKAYWYEHNYLSFAKGYKYKFAFLELDSKRLSQIVRWYLRGMSLSLAVRKVRTDIIVYFERRGIKVFESLEQIQLQQGIQGFKVGYKVTISNPEHTLIYPLGSDGLVVKVHKDFCSVKFNLDSKDENGNDRIEDVPYHFLSIVRPDPPKLKSKQDSKLESKLPARDNKFQPPTKVSKSSVDINPQQSIVEPVEDVKSKHSLTELVAKLKLFKNQTLPTNQHKLLSATNGKSKYTASELAQILNVSKAKIYTMRAKGELESFGYRAESNGRFLSFIAID